MPLDSKGGRGRNIWALIWMGVVNDRYLIRQGGGNAHEGGRCFGMLDAQGRSAS